MHVANWLHVRKIHVFELIELKFSVLEFHFRRFFHCSQCTFPHSGHSLSLMWKNGLGQAYRHFWYIYTYIYWETSGNWELGLKCQTQCISDRTVSWQYQRTKASAVDLCGSVCEIFVFPKGRIVAVCFSSVFWFLLLDKIYCVLS